MATLWLEPAAYSAWRLRAQAEAMGGNLTWARLRALVCLLALLASGADDTTDAAVAALSGVCARTVRYARCDAARLGLLTWQRTRRWTADGWRQGSNIYAVRVPETPVCPPDGKPCRARQDKDKKAWERPASARSMVVALGYTPDQIATAAALAQGRAMRLGLTRGTTPANHAGLNGGQRHG